MGEEEEYLGGFTSAKLAKGLIAGYGIYATNKRIIGVKSRKGVLAGNLVRVVLSGALGAVVGGKLGEKLTKDESAKMIEELDRKKDFEISKEQISQIEVKKPGFMSGGYLKVKLGSGEEVKVLVAARAQKHEREVLEAISELERKGIVRVQGNMVAFTDKFMVLWEKNAKRDIIQGALMSKRSLEGLIRTAAELSFPQAPTKKELEIIVLMARDVLATRASEESLGLDKLFEGAK